MFKPKNFASPKREKDEQKPNVLPRSLISGLIAAEVLLFLLTIVAMPVYVTSQPLFYKLNYEDKSYYQSWKTSTHAMQSCTDCHVEPGTASYLVHKSKMFYQFYADIFADSEAPLGFSQPPSIKACERCHTRARIQGRNITIPHQKHVYTLEKEYKKYGAVNFALQCTDCHQGLVHGENPKGYNSPSMSLCYRCHNNNVMERLKAGGLKSEIRTISDCRACHQRQIKDKMNPRPELIPATHVSTWRDQDHGKQAVQETAECGMCHNEVLQRGTVKGTSSWSYDWAPKYQGVYRVRTKAKTDEADELRNNSIIVYVDGEMVIPLQSKYAATKEKANPGEPQSDISMPQNNDHIKVLNHAEIKGTAVSNVGEIQRVEISIIELSTCQFRCHRGVPLPHSQQFKVSEEHGKTSREDLNTCLTCHKAKAGALDEKQWCGECHHPPTRQTKVPWIRLHPSIFQVERQVCYNCHTPHECASCHIRGGKRDNPLPVPPPAD